MYYIYRYHYNKWKAFKLIKETRVSIFLECSTYKKNIRVERTHSELIGPFEGLERAEKYAQWLTKRYASIEKGAESAREDAQKKAMQSATKV